MPALGRMQTAPINSPPSRIEAELLRVRAHLDRSEFAQVLSTGQALLREIPENRDLLYMIAVSQRYLHRIPDALATLEVLARHHPTYSRLFQ